MLKAAPLVLVQLLLLLLCWSESKLIVLDDTVGLGRTFDGIGGLSGGSVSIRQRLPVWWELRERVKNVFIIRTALEKCTYNVFIIVLIVIMLMIIYTISLAFLPMRADYCLRSAGHLVT